MARFARSSDDESWLDATVAFVAGDEFANEDGVFLMTKSGNPPPTAYLQVLDDADDQEEMSEADSELLHHLSYGGTLRAP